MRQVIGLHLNIKSVLCSLIGHRHDSRIVDQCIDSRVRTQFRHFSGCTSDGGERQQVTLHCLDSPSGWRIISRAAIERTEGRFSITTRPPFSASLGRPRPVPEVVPVMTRVFPSIRDIVLERWEMNRSFIGFFVFHFSDSKPKHISHETNLARSEGAGSLHVARFPKTAYRFRCSSSYTASRRGRGTHRNTARIRHQPPRPWASANSIRARVYLSQPREPWTCRTTLPRFQAFRTFNWVQIGNVRHHLRRNEVYSIAETADPVKENDRRILRRLQYGWYPFAVHHEQRSNQRQNHLNHKTDQSRMTWKLANPPTPPRVRGERKRQS